MPTVQIMNMDANTEYFVGTCSHVHETKEADDCSARRLSWMRSMHDRGLRVKVALLEEKPIGFLYAMPIEVCPWGPVGKDLLAIPCLYVLNEKKNKGAASKLIAEVEKEALRQGKKGLVTIGYYSDFWFMPARFFEKCGFSPVEKAREVTSEGEKDFLDKEAILWKVLDKSAEKPEFLKPDYKFKPVSGKVVVDLFWNAFCATSDSEAQRVREVASEFGDSVVLNEYPACDPAILSRYQLPRAIFVNGRKIGWGYEAPKEGIRQAIAEELNYG
jgi:GNAT superfamily N-acetyltransferase/thiol-disulfide isomerase/thioredoxin